MDEHQPDMPRTNGVERFRPVRPERPELPDDDSSPATRRSKSSLSIILAGGALLLGVAVLAVLAAPLAGVVLGIIGLVLLLAALAAFHYVVWGWWLGGVIRSEVEADERAEEEANRRIAEIFAAPQSRPRDCLMTNDSFKGSKSDRRISCSSFVRIFIVIYRTWPKYSGALPACHLILQPMLGFCSAGTGLPASTASIARRKSAPVTGMPESGRLESICPRYTSF